MSDIIEDLLVTTDIAAEEKLPWATKALSESDESYFCALARCGEQSEEGVALVEKWITADAKLLKLQGQVAELMTRNPADQQFLKRCRDAFQARADIAALEIQELLNDWWPGCDRIRQPH